MALTLKTEEEAIHALMEIITAMSQDDKETREMLYADYTREDLQRILRWNIRWFLHFFYFSAAVTGEKDPKEALEKYFMSTNLQMMNKEGDEE